MYFVLLRRLLLSCLAKCVPGVRRFVLLFVVIAGVGSSIPCCGSALNYMQRFPRVKLIKPCCAERPILRFIFKKWVLRDLLPPFWFWQWESCSHGPVSRGNEVGCCEKTGWHKHLCITSAVPSPRSDIVTGLPLHLFFFFLFISSLKQTLTLSIFQAVLGFRKHRTESGNVAALTKRKTGTLVITFLLELRS